MKARPSSPRRASWKERLRARYRPPPPVAPDVFWAAFRERAESWPQRETARAWVGPVRRRVAWAAAAVAVLVAGAGLWRLGAHRPSVDGPWVEVVAFAAEATSCMVWQDPGEQGIIVWLMDAEPPGAAGG
jgi:hypothetical protein